MEEIQELEADAQSYAIVARKFQDLEVDFEIVKQERDWNALELDRIRAEADEALSKVEKLQGKLEKQKLLILACQTALAKGEMEQGLQKQMREMQISLEAKMKANKTDLDNKLARVQGKLVLTHASTKRAVENSECAARESGLAVSQLQSMRSSRVAPTLPTVPKARAFAPVRAPEGDHA